LLIAEDAGWPAGAEGSGYPVRRKRSREPAGVGNALRETEIGGLGGRVLAVFLVTGG